MLCMLLPLRLAAEGYTSRYESKVMVMQAQKKREGKRRGKKSTQQSDCNIFSFFVNPVILVSDFRGERKRMTVRQRQRMEKKSHLLFLLLFHETKKT